MKIKMLTTILFLCSIVGFAQEQKMSESEISSFKNAVNSTAKSTKTLTTDFTQYKHLDFLEKDIETSGKMNFKAPGSLQWEYLKPYKYSIVFKNNKIYINDAGKKSNIDNNKMFDKLNKLIVGSVNGNMFDDKEFTISYFKTQDFNITKLLPKDATLKKYIKQMELYFDKSSNTVSQVKMIESSNDFTKIVFKNKSINAKIDDSVFNN